MSEQDTYKVDENSVAIYNHLDDEMMSLHERDTDESRIESESIARQLIAHAELPLIIRVHAHMILASGNGPYLWHAHEAVRVVKRGIELFGSSKTTDSLLAQAETLLSCATRDQDAFAELKTKLMAEAGVELVDQPEPGEKLEKLRYGLGWRHEGEEQTSTEHSHTDEVLNRSRIGEVPNHLQADEVLEHPHTKEIPEHSYTNGVLEPTSDGAASPQHPLTNGVTVASEKPKPTNESSYTEHALTNGVTAASDKLKPVNASSYTEHPLTNGVTAASDKLKPINASSYTNGVHEPAEDPHFHFHSNAVTNPVSDGATPSKYPHINGVTLASHDSKANGLVPGDSDFDTEHSAVNGLDGGVKKKLEETEHGTKNPRPFWRNLPHF